MARFRSDFVKPEDQLFRQAPISRVNYGFEHKNSYNQISQHRHSYYEPINQIQHLSNLCSDLINVRDSYNNPVKYALYVVFSLLDNADVDLCSILPHYDKEHEELTHKLGCLLGYDSTIFKLIFLDEELFDYFLDNFTRHAELSNANFTSAASSLYVWLLNGYLKRLLPINDLELASVQSSTWFKQHKKQPSQKTSKTPFQLLREDLFVNMSDSFEDSYEFDHSTYARLFQFVELLISNYTNMLISPSPAQIVSLKNVVDSYVEFVIAPTADKDLDTFKARLRVNRQFSMLMSPFLKKMLSSSPLNEAFIYYLEILIALLCPTDSMFVDTEALLLFKRFSAVRFVDLLDVLLDRLSNSDIRTLIRLDLLQYYLVVMFNKNFIRMLCDLKVSAINYLKPIQRRLNAVAEATLSSSFFSLTSFMTDMLDKNDEKNVKTYLAIINDRLQSQFVTYPPSDLTDRPIENDSLVDLKDVTTGAVNSTLSRRPKVGIPDYYVDNWNSMYYLTPKGVDQVMLGKARFNFSEYGQKIYATQGKWRWENKWLADKLNRVALKLVHHPYIRYLRRVSNHTAVGPVLRFFMMPRSPPKDVPVYGENIPRHLETINLRIFASYPVLFVMLYLVWYMFSFLLSFIF